MLQNISDIRDFDAMLLRRLKGFRSKFRDWLAPHTLTFAKARVHHVLMPMVGVYTPGWQALPAGPNRRARPGANGLIARRTPTRSTICLVLTSTRTLTRS